MTGFSQKAQKVAQGGMRFLFAPQLGVGFKPVSGLFTGFVKLVAEFMAGAKLLPATHRALHPATSQDARLGEVLAVSYATLRRPGARVDQYFVFAALVSLLALITIMSVYTVAMLLFSGAAHAGFLDDLGITLDINIVAPACTFTGGNSPPTSYFTVSNENCDMAQQWINVLVLGQQNWVSDLTVAAPVGAGLAAMFSTYSSAMLVLGGFLVLYHMLAIVAGTAHEGKMGGRAMNQIWAPIRLVMAIGLLVPVGVNGLNSGQLIVTQVAKWGSAMASNIWVAFADSYAANSGTFVIAPPVPDVKQAVGRALDILICKKGLQWAIKQNPYVKADIVEQDWIATPGSKTISKTWDYVQDGAIRTPATCGYAAVLDPGAKVATAMTTYVAGISFSFGFDLRSLIMKEQKKAFEDMIKGGGTLDTLAQDIFDAGNGSNSNEEAGVAMANKFNLAVYEYQRDLSFSMSSAMASSQIGDYKIKEDAMGRGWMSASVWFNTIARYNAMVLDYSKQVPIVFSTFNVETSGLPITRKFLNNLEVSLATSEALKLNLARIAASDTGGMASNWAASDDGDLALAQKNGLDAFLDVLMNEYKRNLGSIFDTDAVSDINVTAATFSSLRLGTANPLAELSSVGLRLISIAKGAITKMQECSAEAAKQKGTGETTLGCKAGGDLGPAYFIVSAAVGSMIAAGVTLGYMLPLLPFIRFMFGVLTWVMALFETVIAIPVVALGHIKMDGEGLSGPMARGAYLLLMQLFLRPTLMVFGLIAALLIFNLMIVALNEFYTQAVAGALDGGADAGIAVIVYTVIYGSLAYAFANASFKAIDMIPNQCLHWIGGQNLQTVDESHRVTGAVAQTSGLGGHVAGSMSNMASRRIAQQGSAVPPK